MTSYQIQYLFIDKCPFIVLHPPEESVVCPHLHNYNSYLVMNYLSLQEFMEAVAHNESFQHEIKGKRIRKELQKLEEYKQQHLTFKKYSISNAGLSFFIEMEYQHRVFGFEIFLDMDYPFNRPKIFYLHNHSPFAFGQDLLDNLFDFNQSNKNWGPSILLTTIFDNMPKLVQLLFKESQELIGKYQVGDYFPQQILSRHNLELFQVQEYVWKYMLKSTFQRKIALSKQTFLKFNKDGDELKLHSAIKIKDIKEVNASVHHGKFKLEIHYTEGAGKSTLYFGGKEEDIEKILYFMNPIQMAERKLSQIEKEHCQKEKVQEMIQKYSELIEYYSLRDQEKSKRYVVLVQELIKKNYEEDNEPGPKLQEMKEDIKT